MVTSLKRCLPTLHFSGKATQKEFSLTFDDGPHPVHTPELLRILGQFGAVATFFMLGSHVLNYPEVARKIAEAGHEIGNHTFSHVKSLYVSRKVLVEEIQKTNHTINSITGSQPRFFRPPHGMVTPATLSICKQEGLATALWNINSFDFKYHDSARSAQRVNKRLRPGAIVLFHDSHYRDLQISYSETCKAVESVLQLAQERGLSSVSLSRLCTREPA